MGIKGRRCSNVTTYLQIRNTDTKLKLKDVLKSPWYQKSEFSSQIAWQAQIDANWAENTAF